MSESPKNKLFLLDAMALIFRAYYGLGDKFLINSKGMNVTAIQLFTDSLWSMLLKEKPSHLVVAFDTMAPTDRAVEHSFYKANRQETPDDIKTSIPIIKEVLKAMNIAMIELDGYEADDVIGTVAKQQATSDMPAYMVTPDKDYGQLVDDHIFMYKPPFRGKPEEIYDRQAILDKWGIARIDQVIDLLGLMGDAVDNIPGIPGVGEKTAVKLLAEFDNIENLLENTDKLKGKLKEKVEENKDKAIISKQLATIIVDVPVSYKLDDFKRQEPNAAELKALFTELEFRTLTKRILGEEIAAPSGSKKSSPATNSMQGDLFSAHANDDSYVPGTAHETIESIKHDYQLVDSPTGRAKLITELQASSIFCFDTETTGVDPNNCDLVGIAFSIKKGSGFYVPIPEKKEEALAIMAEFKGLLESNKHTKIGQNLKYDILVLKWYGIDVKGPFFDTMLAHYVLKPEAKHGMDVMSTSYLNYKPVSIETLIGKKGAKQGSMRDVPVELAKEYAVEDTDITLQLKEIFEKQLKEDEMEKLFTEIEVPLLDSLVAIEYEGVQLDVAFLSDYSKTLGADLIELEKNIFDIAGTQFNMNSPKQLGDILFNHLKIPYKGKKTSTGQYSTNEDILKSLEHESEIINHILNYREVNKLKSTYVDSLPNLVNPRTGRLHSSFRQAVVPTGRLSSDNPNLQNIPIRTERGREVRKAFIPRNSDNLLLSADYSQVELRILASMSEDELMIQAFLDGEDIHSATAAKVFGVPLAEVTREMRGKAKAVNFGLAYGQTAFGLSQNLGISRTEAKEIIENYFAKYPGIQTCMENNKEYARKHGYSITLLGRKRYLADINSGNQTVRGFAERNAINSPIQGSAADIIKLAMIDIQKEIEKRKLSSRMILQVHDELVFDVVKTELEEMKELVNSKMSKAYQLKVPLVVDMGFGENWLEAH